MLQNYIKYNTKTVSKSTQDCSPLLCYRFVSTALTAQIPNGNAIANLLGLLHTGKERNSETGFSYFGARYYDSDILTGWLSVDPMADKYPSLSPYAYCGWNPIKLVDPDGKECGDYYDKFGKYIGSDGNNDNKVYVADPNGDIQFMPYILKESRFREVGTIDNIEMIYIGKILQNSEKASGTLNIIQNVGEKSFIRDSYDAISGSRSLYPLQNGKYITDNLRERKDNLAMIKEQVGFSIDLSPTFQTNRTLLRIHPDGGLPGTEGCIGLIESESRLMEFKELMSLYYNQHSKISLTVEISGNENHSTQKKRK